MTLFPKQLTWGCVTECDCSLCILFYVFCVKHIYTWIYSGPRISYWSVVGWSIRYFLAGRWYVVGSRWFAVFRKSFQFGLYVINWLCRDLPNRREQFANNQSSDTFEDFADNLELNLDKIAHLVNRPTLSKILRIT